MLVSILHRVTGSALSLAGLPLLVWFLGSLASGPEAYAAFTAVMGSIPGFIVLFGLSWAFFTHMMSGLRHFVLDIGAGYDLDVNRFWSVASPIIAIALTLALWSYLLLAKGV
jgi:succinate dehydrogenase / fumarate reductase cytochrome b subunit